MRLFDREDCERNEEPLDLYQKVVVYARKDGVKSNPDQLFLCMEKAPVEGENLKDSLLLVSLSNGEFCLRRWDEMIGILKPELLPDEAKLHLSQIAIREGEDFEKMDPQYSGYCFLSDGRYTSGVWLCRPREVMDFVELQKSYQHRVLICDRDDFAVMEFIDGQLIYPDAQALEDFRKEQRPDGGLTMT